MKHHFNQLSMSLSRVNQRHVQLVLIILSLALFAIGAGAPDAGGGIGISSLPGTGK